MKKFLMALAACVGLVTVANAGTKFTVVDGKVTCEETANDAPILNVPVKQAAAVVVPTAAEPEYRDEIRYVQVCDGGTCRLVQQVVRVPVAAAKAVVNAISPTCSCGTSCTCNTSPAAAPAAPSITWASPTGGVTYSAETSSGCASCSSCGTSAASQAFPRLAAAREHFAARPKLFNGPIVTKIRSLFGR